MKDQLLYEKSKPSVIDLQQGTVEPITEEREADEATHAFEAAQYATNEGEDSATDYEND